MKPLRARRPFPRVLALGALGALGATLGANAAPRSTNDPGVAWRSPAPTRAMPAVTARIDERGQSASPVKLPSAPHVTFQSRIAPPIIGEPMADGGGQVLVAHGFDRLSRLDARGHTVLSLRLGAELASGPIPLGGERTLLVARDGRVFEVSRAGVPSERESLPWPAIEGAVLATPTADGGAILATGARLARLGPAGTRGWDTELPDPIRAVFAWRGFTLAVGHDGSVWSRGVSGDPKELTSFALPVREVMLLGDRLIGLTEHALVDVDLATKQRGAFWADVTLTLRDMALVNGTTLRVVAGKSTLVDVDAKGHELARFALPTGESGAELGRLIVDRTGATLLTTTGAPLLTVTLQGDASAVPATGCPDPLRPTPVADGTLLLACRSGLLRGLSDRAP